MIQLRNDFIILKKMFRVPSFVSVQINYSQPWIDNTVQLYNAKSINVEINQIKYQSN